MQYAFLPLKYIGISQGVNGNVSHQGLKAIDFGWRSGYDWKNIYAPFDGSVVAFRKGTNIICFQSDDKVKWADGTEDYMTIISCHHTSLPKIGTHFKQGEVYAQMGNVGANGATHCHLEVQKGKFKKWTHMAVTGKRAVSLMFPDTVLPYEVLFKMKDAEYSPNSSACPYKWKEVDPEPDYKSMYFELLKKYEELTK